jgi:hypothetical protein
LIRSGGRRALLHGDLAIANPHSLGSGLGSLRPGPPALGRTAQPDLEILTDPSRRKDPGGPHGQCS